jgi:hypothetical protein
MNSEKSQNVIGAVSIAAIMACLGLVTWFNSPPDFAPAGGKVDLTRLASRSAADESVAFDLAPIITHVVHKQLPRTPTVQVEPATLKTCEDYEMFRAGGPVVHICKPVQ